VPPAARALYAATQGPRVLPGTYTVKMTKGGQTYAESLKVALDPRATYTVEDRKQQFELAMRLYRMLGHMSYAVAAISGVTNDAQVRAAKLPEKDPLRARLQQLAQQVDALRSKIVATKEGGAVTGEERIREYVGDLYGDVNQYEGRPADYQLARAESLSRDLEDVITDFHKLTNHDLQDINAALKKKKTEPISVPAEADWQKQHEQSASASGSAMETRERD